MTKITLIWIAASFILLNACTNEIDSTQEKNPQPKNEEMKTAPSNLISLFEIPTSDLSRAIAFYEELLEIDIEQMEMEGMKMGILPYENQPVSGILIETEGYSPSSDGTVLYFNVGVDVQLALDKVKQLGGEILVPKMVHADESGYFAIILDSEGNKIGLNSPS